VAIQRLGISSTGLLHVVRNDAGLASYWEPFNVAAILVLHGPNLNLLGTREPALYGHTTLADVDAILGLQANALGHQIRFFQSNSEHALIEHVHDLRQNPVDMVLINPGAFTHTSIALRDALVGVAAKFIEVHLSNVHAREDFRRRSYFSDVALGVICGFGTQSYELALSAADRFLAKAKSTSTAA
jgi:3-dehydroquinate dehydratase II